MIIKRLELQGFKTFPERTKIVFNPGITIIIGPNGTGKSNIVEAIQWVLGGQRVKSVRGEKIEDAIFSGTVKRASLGMAEVTLVLQNTGEEMQIGHRVFRSGESEYRLDGKVVRLKDIQDELWKKAISENKYFVIEQGAIGTFVTSKPIEKRTLIEEAAGTAYYKDKKRQAENKLADSEQNLVRLEDIIAEVSKAKNSLARQASAAEKYRMLREHVRELTTRHFRNRSGQLLAVQAEVQTRFDAALAAELDALARLNAEDRVVGQKRRDAWDLEQSLKQGRESLFALKSQAARFEAERERESKRAEFFEDKRKKAASDTDEFLAAFLNIKNDLAQAREDLAAQTQSLARKRNEAAELERSHGEAEAALKPRARTLESLREEHLLVFAEVTNARNEGAKTEKELELVRRQEEKIHQRQDEARRKLDLKTAGMAELESRRGRAEADIAAASERRAGRRDRAAEIAAAVERGRDEMRRLKEKRDEDVFHLQALRKLEAKERAAEPLFGAEGALGTFTDLLESDPADAFLVDVFWKDEARATLISAEELLKNLTAREIRGHFLLLTDRSAPAAPHAVIVDPDVEGLLKTRLRASPKMTHPLPRLQDAVIVRDTASAIRLWLQNPSLNFISLKGDVLFATGLLKLGQAREGLFALAQDIKDLERKIAVHDEAMTPVVTGLEENIRNQQSLEDEIRSESVLLTDLEHGLQDVDRDIALSKAEKENLENDLALFAQELDVLGMDKDGFSRRWEAQAQAVRGCEEKEQALRGRVETEDQEFGLHQEKIRSDAKALLEFRGSLDVLQERIQNLEALIADFARRKETTAAKLAAFEDEIRAAAEERDRTQALIAELGDKASDHDVRQRTLDRSLEESEIRLQVLQTDLTEAEAGLTRLRGDYEATKDARMACEVRKAETDRDLVNLEETCWQDMKKSLQDVKAEAAAAGLEDAEVETELEEAKDKLQKYGAVNLMADEEYREQKARYEFLIQQKKDLTESIAQTKEAIVKIDEESRLRFLAALAEINVFFQDLFVSLFKGGTAEVRLTDETNPLESGVDVIAQPPGKKVQNMGLLSGGEKSLTSLAFLFSLFRYKPTPFCILDEVDAALDEVNLVRFLDLMRAIKAETQFIIITHNYKTMEVADYIYGTTMEEPNVTKVFSMKLEKKEDAVHGD
jgi:chromosome segregation protein